MFTLKSNLDNAQAEIYKLKQQCDELCLQRDNVIQWFQDEKVKLMLSERKARGKARLDHKEIYLVEELRYRLAEVQNRLIDSHWEN